MVPTVILLSTSTAMRSVVARKRIDVVRHHEHGQTQALLQVPHQRVELRRGDRIEARGRFVEKQQLGIERQGARQAGPLAHAAGQLRGISSGGIRRQPDHAELH